jgi:hypothetical protein
VQGLPRFEGALQVFTPGTRRPDYRIVPARSGTHDIEGAVVIAVVAVRMVQLPLHEVTHVISMRNRFVPAAISVPVPLIVAVAESGGALRGVTRVHADPVLIDVVLVRVVQTSVVEIVGVPLVTNCRVSTVGSVLVIVTFVDLVVM